jgi:apolipoprotein N-acyltransferase
MSRIKQHVDRLRIPILTGALDAEWSEDGNHKIFNSVFLLEPGSWDIQQYDKMKLVPFGERVPLVGQFPFLYDLAKKTDLDIGGFSPGDSVVVFELETQNRVQTIPFATVICYESIFPYLVQRFIRQGAKFLVIITNDGWFGNTSGPYQHARIAVLRAIENGIGVARCANTGISEFIDPMGRILQRSSYNEETVLIGRIDIRDKDTFFLKAGYLFPALILGMNASILLSMIVCPGRIRKRIQKIEHRNPETD